MTDYPNGDSTPPPGIAWGDAGLGEASRESLIEEIRSLRSRLIDLESVARAGVVPPYDLATTLLRLRQFRDTALDSQSLWLSAHRADGRAVMWNRGAETITSIAAEDALDAADLWHRMIPDSQQRDALLSSLESASAGDLAEPLTLFIHTQGGGRIVTLHARPMPGADGDPDCAALYGLDVTERRRVEDKLRSAIEMLQIVMDHIPQGICWKDRNSVFLGCNQAFARLVGYDDPRALVGKTDYDLSWRREEADFFRDWDKRVMEANRPALHILEPARLADGRNALFDASKIPLHDAQGQVVGVLAAIDDITEKRKAEEQLRETREMLMAFMDQLPGAAFIKDEHSKYLLANRHMRRQCGMDDLIGKGPNDMLPPEAARSVIEHDRDARESGPITHEETAPDAEGIERVWQTSLFPLQRDGKPPLLGAISVDISERLRAEEALRENEERLRMVLEATSDGAWDHDLEADSIVYSPTWMQMLGYDPEELPQTPETWTNLMHPDDRENVLRERDRHFAGETETYRVEFRMRAKSGEWRWVLSRGKVVERDDDGHPVRILGSHTDVTELHRAQEALRESEQKHRLIMDAMADSVFICSKDYRVVYANRAARQRFHRAGAREGANGSGVIDQPCFRVASSRDSPCPECPWNETDQGQTTSYEVVNPKEKRVYHATNTGIRLGGEDCVLSIQRDITDLKRIESDRQRLESRMMHAQKLESLGMLAGGVAHDFNNLLMGVLGHTELALEELSDESPFRRHLEQIESAARRAADLSRQMLAYSGQTSFNKQRLNLNQAVEAMGNLLNASIDPKAMLRRRFAPSLPAILADPTQVRQVVMNLVVNASEALEGEQGTITVSTGVQECDRDYLSRTYLDEGQAAGAYVYLEIEDDGCGLDADTRERVFDPFFTTKFTGRGLGLAATLGIIRGHNGAVEVRGEPGKGAKFRVLFPADEQPAESGPTPRTSSAGPWLGRGLALLVDDEPAVLDVSRRMLEKMGLEVLTADNAVDALRMFEQRSGEIDCVVLDLTMPRMTGEEALAKLQAIRADVPVLISSGYSRHEVRSRLANQSFAGFVQKPYTMEILAESLKQALGARQTAEQME